MAKNPQKAGEEIPTATQAEVAIAAIAANHPDRFVTEMNDRRFDPKDILDPLSKAIVDVVILQCAKKSSTDIRILFERVREKLPQVEFFQVSQMATEGGVPSALPELFELVRIASKRRALLGIASQIKHDVSDVTIDVSTLISRMISDGECLAKELTPPKAADTKALLMEAITRYESGDDSTQRIRTGFSKLDNLTPTRFGDFVVIGGETKSGKTMLALNIIANLLTDEISQSNTQ